MADRKVALENAQKFVGQDELAAELRRKKLTKFKETHLNTIVFFLTQQLHNEQKAVEYKLRHEQVPLPTDDMTTSEFKEYSMGLVNEWRAAGRDVRPVLHSLETMLPVPRPAYDGKKINSTYQHLGFSTYAENT